VSLKYGEILQRNGALIKLEERVTGIQHKSGPQEVITDKGTYTTNLVINCAGLYSDKVARLTIPNLNVKIIPFRGEYFKLKKRRSTWLRT